QKVILERQAEIDDDAGDAAAVREAFWDALSCRGHDPETEAIWIPAAVAAEIVNKAMGERFAANRAGVFLMTLSIRELRRSKIGGVRGWAWWGLKSDAQAPFQPLQEAPPRFY